MNTESRLQEGISLHQEGKLDQAELIYQQMLQVNPKNAEVLHLLGMIAYQVEKYDLAINLINQAIEIDNRQPVFFKSLGCILQERKKLREAIRAYQEAIELDPADSKIHKNLGDALKQQGELELAIDAYNKAIEFNPHNAETYNNLGTVLQDKGNLEPAIAAYREALEINPNLANTYYNLGNALREQGNLEHAVKTYHKALKINSSDSVEILNNLGLTLQEQGNLERAIEAYHKALKTNPNSTNAHNNLGNALWKQGNLEHAIETYHKALEINPNNAITYYNLGNILREQGELELAIDAYNKAIEFNPNNAETYNNLGTVLQDKGNLESAIATYRKALEIDPDDQHAHLNISMLHLLQGDFKNGWQQYQWRWKYEKFPSEYRDFPQLFWSGENLSGKTILVWAEQGIGDEIMFASMLHDLRQSNANIMVECERRLVSLFQRSFPDIQFFCRRNPPYQQLLNTSIDYQIPMGSLGQWLRTNLSSFKQDQSYYLTACPDKTAELRNKYQKLANNKKLVGISWKSTGTDKRRALAKSIPLKTWIPILSRSNCYFINLQYGDVGSELSLFESETRLKIYWDQGIDPLTHLDDFAAQISALDLIISIDNSTIHMAGALGKKVWTLLPYAPDWRWLLGTEDTIWYPTMKLFRQNKIEDWQDTFQQLSSMITANA